MMSNDEYRTFDLSPVLITEGGNWDANCASIVIYNQGTQMCVVDGILKLMPGMSFAFDAYPGEKNIHTFSFKFDNESLPGREVVIYRKMF